MNIFVYGELVTHSTLPIVLGGVARDCGVEATVSGYTLVKACMGGLGLIKNTLTSVSGVVFDATPDELKRLTAYYGDAFRMDNVTCTILGSKEYTKTFVLKNTVSRETWVSSTYALEKAKKFNWTYLKDSGQERDCRTMLSLICKDLTLDEYMSKFPRNIMRSKTIDFSISRIFESLKKQKSSFSEYATAIKEIFNIDKDTTAGIVYQGNILEPMSVITYECIKNSSRWLLCDAIDDTRLMEFLSEMLLDDSFNAIQERVLPILPREVDIELIRELMDITVSVAEGMELQYCVFSVLARYFKIPVSRYVDYSKKYAEHKLLDTLWEGYGC